MGLLDVDLMNRIRRTLDDRYGKGEKILFGEPWAAAETAMEGNAVPALKKNIDLLDENIGMFSDDTRDAVKGSARLRDRDLLTAHPEKRRILSKVRVHGRERASRLHRRLLLMFPLMTIRLCGIN